MTDMEIFENHSTLIRNTIWIICISWLSSLHNFVLFSIFAAFKFTESCDLTPGVGLYNELCYPVILLFNSLQKLYLFNVK